jgi:phage terminase large subunit
VAHPAVVDGVLDAAKLWEPTAKNKIIRQSTSHNRLRVGGTGSSKSSDAMMEIVTDFLLRFPGCMALILRRTMPELKRSNIPNFKSYVPSDLYTYNSTDNIATFYNGSKLFFSHLQYFTWKEQF